MSEIINSVLQARYFTKDEHSWEDVCKRVSNFIGNTDEERERFYNLMVEGKFIPNSPTLFNAGLPNGQLSACFVLPIHDSMASIFGTLGDCAQIFKSGGGCGFSFDELRQKNSPVGESNGVASGAVSFMRVYDAAIESIKAGGRRRGAAMGVLPVNHGDIMDFVKCKTEEGQIRNFNISVMITDDFMEKVKNKRFSDVVTHEILDDGSKRDVTVGEIWQSIVHGAWKNGEPGVLFDGNINKDNKLIKISPIKATNPCVTGDTLILTDEGYKPIIETIGKETNVWNGIEFSKVVPFLAGENETVYDVTFSNGTTVRATGNHKWFTVEGVKTTLELSTSDKLIKCAFPVIEGTEELPDAYKFGFFCGDGSECKDGTNKIHIYGEKHCCFADLDYSNIKSNLKIINVPKWWSKTFVPDISYTVESRKQWLAGLIDSDGCATFDGGYQISSVNKEFLLNVGYMLNTLGCPFKITLMKNADVRPLPDGKGGYANYYCQTSYRLLISKANAFKLDLPLKRVMKYTECQRDAGQFVRVVSIVEYGQENVYCCTEPKRHQITLNGNPSGNCGEQPLLPYESCNLGSLNLSAYWKNGKFDDESFEKDIVTAVEFLNDVVDKNAFPIKELKAMNDETRKIGLGIMGYHDLLLKMRIPYDSEEALSVLDGIMAKIRRVAERTSHLLAKRDGVFPAWEESEWTMEVRNGGLLTIAPTGSISLLANCSSGIEPVFNWVYKRRNTVGKEFLMVHPLFDVDLRKMVMDDDALYNEIVNQVYNEGTLQNVDVLPQKVKDLYKCALDIAPVWHIRTQATAQKYIDASISKTINLPEQATPADVAEIYTMAYDLGCKGITLYRTNSRKDVVLQNAQQQENGFVEVIKDGEIYVKCPECGGLTKGKGGCNVCEHCGFTKCS